MMMYVVIQWLSTLVLLGVIGGSIYGGQRLWYESNVLWPQQQQDQIDLWIKRSCPLEYMQRHDCMDHCGLIPHPEPLHISSSYYPHTLLVCFSIAVLVLIIFISSCGILRSRYHIQEHQRTRRHNE